MVQPTVHRIELPRMVVIGRGSISALGAEVRRLGKGGVLVVASGGPWAVAGERVRASLEEEGLEHGVELVSKRSLVEDSEKAASAAAERGFTVVVGVGGGAAIDTAKLAAKKAGAQLISVPTAASHDGIASSLVSMPSAGRRYSFPVITPSVIVADTEVIAHAPYRLTASGCGDVLAKHVAVRDWRLAHLLTGEYYGEYAASLAEASVQMIVENADVIRTGMEEGVRVVMEALIHCGIIISVAGSSRPCSGSEHLFSHALDEVARRPGLHGEQVGVGTIMMSYLHGTDWRLIRDTLRKIGAPTTARELGVSGEEVVEALMRAQGIRPDRLTILGERGLTREAAEKLAKATGVID